MEGLVFFNEKFEYRKRSLVFKPQDHEYQIRKIRNHLDDNSRFEYEDNNWLGITNHLEDEKYYRDKIQDQISIVSKHKNLINSIYNEQLPIQICKRLSADWRFNISVTNKKIILDEIFKNNLFASSHYASVSAIFGLKESPVAFMEHQNRINLFNDLRVQEEFAIRICKIINNHIC